MRPALLATLLAPLALAACTGTPVSPAQDPTGLWTGALVTDQGKCPTERNSSLQISQKNITFTPADGSLILHGTRGTDPNKFHAELVTQDANHKPLPMVFNALPVGLAIGGTYGTPSCRAHITLTRAHY